MATLSQALKNSQKLTPKKIEELLFKSIKKIEKKLIQINQKQIFEKSSDIFGNSIGFYSKATEIISKGRKKQGEPFDLFDKGDFFKGFFIRIDGDNVFFGSSDPKTGLIFENLLSVDIFGLTENNLSNVIQKDIKPLLQKEIRKILKL